MQYVASRRRKKYPVSERKNMSEELKKQAERRRRRIINQRRMPDNHILEKVKKIGLLPHKKEKEQENFNRLVKEDGNKYIYIYPDGRQVEVSKMDIDAANILCSFRSSKGGDKLIKRKTKKYLKRKKRTRKKNIRLRNRITIKKRKRSKYTRYKKRRKRNKIKRRNKTL